MTAEAEFGDRRAEALEDDIKRCVQLAEFLLLFKEGLEVGA
ncbi:MAG: hypothetical protein R2706_15310 [Acidimicrobiales bacterium]